MQDKFCGTEKVSNNTLHVKYFWASSSGSFEFWKSLIIHAVSGACFIKSKWKCTANLSWAHARSVKSNVIFTHFLNDDTTFKSPRQVSYHTLLGTMQIKQKRHSPDINIHTWVDKKVIKFHRICTFRYPNCLLSIQISSWNSWPEANKKPQNSKFNKSRTSSFSWS